MFVKLIVFLNRLYQKRNAPKVKKWLKWIRNASSVLLVAVSVYYLACTAFSYTGEINWRSNHLNWQSLLVSFALSLLSIGLGAIVWYLIICSLGSRLSIWSSWNVQVTSNLAKYIPGYAWQILGKAYLTQRYRVPSAVVILGIIIELAGLFLTGVLMALLSLPEALVKGTDLTKHYEVQIQNLITTRPVLLVIISLIVLFIPYYFHFIIHFLKLRAEHIRIRISFYWASLAVYLVAWLFHGLTLQTLISAIGEPIDGISTLTTFIMAISYIVSLLALFVPGGIGVREGVLVYFLAGSVSGGAAVMVAVMMRIIQILSELSAYGLSKLVSLSRKAIPREAHKR